MPRYCSGCRPWRSNEDLFEPAGVKSRTRLEYSIAMHAAECLAPCRSHDIRYEIWEGMCFPLKKIVAGIRKELDNTWSLITNWKSYVTFIKPNPPRLHINKPCNNICALEIMFIHYAIFMYINVYLLTSLHIYTLAYNSNLTMHLHLYNRLYISHPIHSENLLFIWAYLWMSSRHWQ